MSGEYTYLCCCGTGEATCVLPTGYCASCPPLLCAAVGPLVQQVHPGSDAYPYCRYIIPYTDIPIIKVNNPASPCTYTTGGGVIPLDFTISGVIGQKWILNSEQEPELELSWTTTADVKIRLNTQCCQTVGHANENHRYWVVEAEVEVHPDLNSPQNFCFGTAPTWFTRRKGSHITGDVCDPYGTYVLIPMATGNLCQFNLCSNSSVCEPASIGPITIGTECGDKGFGACCLPNGACTVTTPTQCAIMNGVFTGQSSCSPYPCEGGDPIGACCRMHGSCIPQTQTACNVGGGVWQGPGTACNPNPCIAPAIAMCCLPNGDCINATEIGCLLQGGIWQGLYLCETAPESCPTQDRGACCVLGNCFGDKTKDECDALVGRWFPGKICTDTLCGIGGFPTLCYCCDPLGQCVGLIPIQQCIELGGNCAPPSHSNPGCLNQQGQFYCTPQPPQFMPTIVGDDDWSMLESGQQYIDPMGNVRVKQ